MSNWASPALFQTYWSANKSAFSGAHRITCRGDLRATIDFGSKWTLTGDTTIYSDGPISLSKDIVNGAGGPVTLTIVSDAADSGPTPAISMSNNVTLPDDINVVFFAKNGTVKFSQLKHFTGTVYASVDRPQPAVHADLPPGSPPGLRFRADVVVALRHHGRLLQGSALLLRQA